MSKRTWMLAALAALLLPLAVWAAAAAATKPEAHATKPAAHAAAPMHHTVMKADDLKWGPVPPVFSAGAQMAVLQGDPGKAGEYTVRLSAPDGYKVAPHWHPTTENVTVISGTFHVGAGDEMDTTKGDAVSAGGFVSLPAHMHHYAWMEGATVVQVHGMGPFKLTYVHAADDPRMAKKP